jgi:hypothetical protein
LLRAIHPFPARMAPDIAISELQRIPPGGLIVDPMTGSGTVLRHASDCGHRALGLDLDPLAVLMARVWTTAIRPGTIERILEDVLHEASREVSVELPWIDEDDETRDYVRYWFGARQRVQLRRLAFAIKNIGLRRRSAPERAAMNLLKLSLSRIIITKETGASLARDVSHSRPHKVTTASKYDVLAGFHRSASRISSLLKAEPPRGNVEVRLGDARRMACIADMSVDAVLTSPPYLNAIDYMRGHRLALVWLGFKLSQLRGIRSLSIGAERGPDLLDPGVWDAVTMSMTKGVVLSDRHRFMVTRYAQDSVQLMGEIRRILKPAGRALVVVGNSFLKGSLVQNDEGLACAAQIAGLQMTGSYKRELPVSKRYLPTPATVDEPLGKRMRTETILTFESV